jgi:threonine dehydrogenase-like Zn-dependent dehydrogenase
LTVAATATQRAMLLLGRRSLRHVQAPFPEPAPNEVLIRVEGCGVCASSLPIWEGREWFSYPLPPGAPGHEVWGRTEDGRRVAALCFRGFAEYDVAAADTVVELPAALEGVPFPGEALACAVNVVRRAALPAAATVAVVGMGFLGTTVSRLIGDVAQIRRDTACEDEFDVVIEAAGTQDALDTASRLVAPGGRLIIAGFHQDGPRTIDLQSWNWRGLDVVNAHERDPQRIVRGIREAAQLVVDGVLDIDELITHRLPLSQLESAFELATARPPGFLKAVVCP